MNSTQLRFTLINDTLGSLVVNDPEGYDTIPLTLEREKDFSEVMEKFTSPLTFNQNAISYLESAEALGIDTKVVCKVEVSEDYGVTWENFFPEGLIDFETKLRLDEAGQEYKLQYNIKQNDLWSAFYNRKSTPVNVMSTTDLDGNVVSVPSVLNLALPSQKIPQIYDAHLGADVSFDDLAVNEYIQFDFDDEVLNEITYKFGLSVSRNPNIPQSLWTLQYDGNFTSLAFRVTLSTAFSGVFSPLGGVTSHMNLYFRVVTITGVTTDYIFTQTNFSDRSEFTIIMPIGNLLKGDSIILYGKALTAFTISIGNQLIMRGGFDGVLSYFTQAFISYQSVFPSSVTEAIFLHDVANSIIKRISPTSLHSPFFGGAAQGYGSDGCGYPYINVQGLQLRGFKLIDKPFAINFDDWWAGANPIFNLGLGTEVVGGVERIYIDEKSKFYDASGFSLKLNFVNKVSKTLKFDKVYKSVEIGYTKSDLNSAGSAIDDPQTSHKYASPLRLVGQTISIMSKWIAASLLFELTRRATLKLSETFDTDNNVFVLKILPDLVTPSPDVTGTATNLLNPTGRYNKNLTPARNFLRWSNVLNVGQTLGNLFKFISGIGNFTASINIAPGSCSDSFTGPLAENANVTVSANVLHGIGTEEFESSFSWLQYKTLKAAKRKRIGISETDIDHDYYYIEKFNFYLLQGKAKFTLIKAA